MGIGSNIRKNRMDKKISLRGLALKAEISNSTLSDIENENTNSSTATLEKIADALETPLFYIIEGSDKLICAIKEVMNNRKINIEEMSKITKMEIDGLESFLSGSLFLSYERYKQLIDTILENIDTHNFFDFTEFDIQTMFHETSGSFKKNSNTHNATKYRENNTDSQKYINEIPSEFINPEEAREYIKKHYRVFSTDGFDADKIDDEKILAFANALLEQIRLVGYKYTKQ